MFKANTILSGKSGETVSVYFDGKDIHELSNDVANAFGWAHEFDWSTYVVDLRCNLTKQQELREIHPGMSEEAYRAILDANIRGVAVQIIRKSEERKKIFWNKMCDYNFFHSRFSHCSESQQKKIRKWMDLENYTWFD